MRIANFLRSANTMNNKQNVHVSMSMLINKLIVDLLSLLAADVIDI